MMRRIRTTLLPLLRTPWLYLVLFLTVVFVATDIGSVDPGRSGLISIARGENALWLTCAWFLAALSVVTLPLFFLWQEQTITRVDRSGYLSLLLTSRLPERRYRSSRLRAGFQLAGAVALFTGLIGAATISGLELPAGHAGNILLAGLVIHLPNLVLGTTLAAFLSRMEERAVALGIGIATPLALIMTVGLTADLVPAGLPRQFFVSIEPTGTLFFAELYRSSTGTGWGTVSILSLLPLALNRLLVFGTAAWLGRRYLSAPSVFEQSPRPVKPRSTLFRRLSSFTVSFTLALIAALMAVSNIHSNFSKNLTFYEIDPSMGFLFRAALGDVHAYLVAVMILLIGKVVWDSRETGFHVLELSGRMSGPRLASTALVQIVVAIVTFTIIVIAATSAMFAGHWDALSIGALFQYAIIRWVPGVLLTGSIFYLLSLLAPNRVTGYFVAIACVVAFLVARSRGLLDLPFSLVAPPLSWSTLTRRVSLDVSEVTGAMVRLGVALLIVSLASTIAGRWRRLEASWVSKRAMRASLTVATAGLVIVLGSSVAADLTTSGPRSFPRTAEVAASYETAAAGIQNPSAWTTLGAEHLLEEAESGATVLTSTLQLARREQGVSRIPITWAVRLEQIEAVRLDGQATVIRFAAPGLFLIDSPGGDVELTLRAIVARSGPDAVTVDSFHGSWPTMPVVGILPELFLREASSRQAFGLPAESPPISSFHVDGLSRAALDASITVEHPCRHSAVAPFAPVSFHAGAECSGRTGPRVVRNELLAASGSWDSLERIDSGGRISLLFPSQNREVARLFLDDSTIAKRAVADALRRTEPLDLTITAGGIPQIGSSNALSKPGVILISDVMVLDTALRSEERRRRFVTLMAHEIAHQWFGPARSGVPGAIFVNEVPAELVRGYVTLRLFGEDGYRLYLHELRSRADYTLRTQRTPDGAPIEAIEADEMYYRAAILGAFVTDRIGWSGLLDNLSTMATGSAAPPSTSRDVARRLLRGLTGRDLAFARLLIETDTTFQWDGVTLSASCTENCPEESAGFPVAEGHTITWHSVDEVTAAHIERSPIGPLVIGHRSSG